MPAGRTASGEAAIDAWSERNAAALERSLGMVADIRASRIYDMTTLPVALREIRGLLRGTTRTGVPTGGLGHDGRVAPRVAARQRT